MPKSPCLLVCPFQFLGDLVESHLASNRYPVVARASDAVTARQAVEQHGEKIAIIVLAFCTDHSCQPGFIGWLGEQYPEIRIAVVTTRFDTEFLTTCVNAGIDGFLYADMAPAGFVASLDLLMAGEKVLPSRLAADIREGDIVVTTTGEEVAPKPADANLLSELEIEILRHVAAGAANKAIAAECSLTEASVKMYLRQIFAKLGVQNRAQAAAWAASEGQGLLA